MSTSPSRRKAWFDRPLSTKLGARLSQDEMAALLAARKRAVYEQQWAEAKRARLALERPNAK